MSHIKSYINNKLCKKRCRIDHDGLILPPSRELLHTKCHNLDNG